jgi:hypothetical protein
MRDQLRNECTTVTEREFDRPHDATAELWSTTAGETADHCAETDR